MNGRGLGAVGVLVVGTGLLQSPSVHAQYIEGAGRIGLEGNVLSSFSLKMATDAGKIDTTRSDAGVLADGAGLVFGYAPAEYVLLGARFGYATTTQTIDEPGVADVKASGFVLSPRLDFVLAPGSTARPSLGPALEWESVTTEAAGMDVSASTFLYGVRGGLHIFADSSVSIDPAVTLGGVSGSLKVGDIENDQSGFGVLLSVAISGWFGGAASRPPAEALADAKAPAGGEAEAPRALDADPVAAAPPAEDLDALSVGFRVDDGKGVRINGRPRKNGSGVLILITLPTDGADPGDCPKLTVHGDDESFEVKRVRVGSAKHGFSQARYVQATIPIEAVDALGEARGDAWLEVCGERWDVPKEARRRLFRFAGRFREQAEAFGTWQPRPSSADEPEEDEAGATEEQD